MDLLEEHGLPVKKRLTRLRRGRGSESPQASSAKRRPVVESSDDDLDHIDFPKVQDIQKIWEDGRDEDEDGDMDMSSFIESDEPEEGAQEMGEDRQKRKERRNERRRIRGAPPEFAGIDAGYVFVLSPDARTYKAKRLG